MMMLIKEKIKKKMTNKTIFLMLIFRYLILGLKIFFFSFLNPLIYSSHFSK